MSKYECNDDNEFLENGMWIDYDDVVAILNNQDQRITELEEQLKNAIVPKFKLGQKVWYVYNKYQKFPFRCVIDKIVYDSSKNYKFRYDTSDELYIGIKEEDLFVTEQEAQAKLKELQGENNVKD